MVTGASKGKPDEELYNKYVGAFDRMTATLGAKASTYNSDSLEYDEPADPRPPYNPRVHGNYADYLAKYPEKSSNPDTRINPVAGMSEEEIKAYIVNQQALFNGHQVAPVEQAESSRRPNRDYSEATRARNQMSHYFDYDSYMTSQDGRSLKEERRRNRLTKQQVHEYRVAKKEKKEKKTREWLGRSYEILLAFHAIK